jgi:hypothetical protein
MSWAVFFSRYDGRLKQWRLALHNWDPGGKFGPAKDAETAEATTEVTSIEEAEKLAMQFTAGVVGAKFHVWLFFLLACIGKEKCYCFSQNIPRHPLFSDSLHVWLAIHRGAIMQPLLCVTSRLCCCRYLITRFQGFPQEFS